MKGKIYEKKGSVKHVERVFGMSEDVPFQVATDGQQGVFVDLYFS